MERPLANKRPFGPFAQSSDFNNTLLSSHGSDTNVQEGNTLLVEILGDSPRDSVRMLEDVVAGPLSEFTDLVKIGDGEGRREQTSPGRDVDVSILYYYVDGVSDPDVTIGQVEEFLHQELTSGSASVYKVNVVEVS